MFGTCRGAEQETERGVCTVDSGYWILECRVLGQSVLALVDTLDLNDDTPSNDAALYPEPRIRRYTRML